MLATLGAAAMLVAGCGGDGQPQRDASSAQTSPSAAERIRYVNMGDSFAAGTGVPPLVEDSNIYCQRSSKNYAHLVAEAKGYDLVDVSCAGAETEHYRTSQHEGIPPQLDALDENTDIVTMMIGGNDEKTYGRAIELCGAASAEDLAGSPCWDTYRRSLIEPVRRQIYPALRETLREVKEKAPNAEVYLVGYPWLLPAENGCYPDMRVAEGDVEMIRQLQMALNTYGRRAANEADVEFVDMSEVSEGHDACAGNQRWIEPQTVGGLGAVHPNERGQQGIAEQVQAALDAS